MHAEWCAECAAEDPVLVVPWKAEDGSAEFIDLRENPYDAHEIAEAEEHPPLLQALRALNAARSPVFTAKCDAWAMPAEEVEALHAELSFERVIETSEAAAGFASYIDLLWRERAVFTSYARQEQTVQRLVRYAAGIERHMAAMECVVRPAVVDLAGAQEGYAVSLYVKALGADPQSAWQEWSAALEAVVALLRGRELAPGK